MYEAGHFQDSGDMRRLADLMRLAALTTQTLQAGRDNADLSRARRAILEAAAALDAAADIDAIDIGRPVQRHRIKLHS